MKKCKSCLESFPATKEYFYIHKDKETKVEYTSANCMICTRRRRNERYRLAKQKGKK